MGVYIKNMEMPKGDTGILLALYNGEAHLIGGEIVHVGKGKGFEAVVVPEPHGRLIDADALKDTLDYYIREAGWGEEINKALGWVKDEFIDSEQTVIPASREEGE